MIFQLTFSVVSQASISSASGISATLASFRVTLAILAKTSGYLARKRSETITARLTTFRFLS